jgi:hypothetical protein
MAMHRNRSHGNFNHQPLRDSELFDKFCIMVPECCFAWDDTSKRIPFFKNPKTPALLLPDCSFTMFVFDEPGHPVACFSRGVHRRTGKIMFP